MASKSASSMINSILTNRYVLYAMLFLSVLTIIGYIALADYLAIGIFIVAGIVATYFTKNMILILGAAILAASALGVRGSIRGAVEGMTSKKDSKSDSDSDVKATSDDDDDKDSSSNEPIPASASAGKKAGGSKKQGFQANSNKLHPAKVSGSDEMDDDEIIGKRIDYAATIEQAYDHLQSMIGDKGMSGLTNETEKLINQQKTLMETLSTMAPVLESAKSTIGALNMTGLFGGGKAPAASK